MADACTQCAFIELISTFDASERQYRVCDVCVCDCVFRLNLNKSGRTLRLSRQTTASLTHSLSSMNNCCMSGTYRCVTTLSRSLVLCEQLLHVWDVSPP